MNLPVEVYAAGRKLEVVLQDLSHTGMFLRLVPPMPVGTIIHIAMEPAGLDGQRVVTAGTVVHTLDEHAARAQGRVAGIGVAFRDPIRPGDQQFAEGVTALLASQVVAPPVLRRIVIADAHTHLLEGMSFAFHDAGFQVATATTGLEALAACLKRAPDVIVLERGLPVMDAFEVMAQLAARPALADIPVIVSSYDPADAVVALELGALDFVTRPFNVHEVILRAGRLARRLRADRHAARPFLLRGSLAAVPLPSLLTMCEQDRQSGQLELTHGTAVGTIELVDGRIVGARSTELLASGRTILMSLLDWTAGDFELTAGCSTQLADEDLAVPVTHLLLEHARIRDESARARRLRLVI